MRQRKTKLRGSCFCGSFQFQLLDKPMWVQCCHCTECQRQTGGPFVINALIETSCIEIVKGSLEKVAMSPAGDPPHDIYRCDRCKTAVWSDYGRRDWIRFVRVMTLKNSKNVRPNCHIFTSTKLPWVRLPAGTPAFKSYYKLEKYWPKQSLERRRRAMESSLRSDN